ncbi:hypothetical protein TNCV_4062821 [Trichonephila clavipes]|nr:hypothetical protein TNCV_4062821 [Trichonephila clavipes]
MELIDHWVVLGPSARSLQRAEGFPDDFSLPWLKLTNGSVSAPLPTRNLDPFLSHICKGSNKRDPSLAKLPNKVRDKQLRSSFPSLNSSLMTKCREEVNGFDGPSKIQADPPIGFDPASTC